MFDDDHTYGISILIKSRELKEMGFIVDHIENLIKDWYPGRYYDYNVLV